MATSVLAPWLVEMALVTYRAIKSGGDNPIPHAPVPSTYTSTFIVYGALTLLPKNIGPLIGWGFVVATLLNLWTPGGAVAKPPKQSFSTPQGAPA